jgi:hypothetical protein
VNDTRSRLPLTAPGEAPHEHVPAGRPGAWARFWFSPADPIGLHAVRVLTGLLLLAWLLPLAGQADGLFGLYGWFDRQAYAEAARLLNEPLRPMGWSLAYLAGSTAQTLTALYWGSIAVLALFTLGVWTRVTGVLTWVIVISFTVNPAIEYDADAYLALFALYLMVGYLFLGLGRRDRSLGRRLLGPTGTLLLGRGPDRARPSVAANLALRLLQVHFAILIVTSGLHKLQFGEWWAGLALWYPLHPAGQTTLKQVRELAADARGEFALLSIGAYAMLLWQLAFPFFAWRRPRPAAGDAADGFLRKSLRAVLSPRTLLLGGGLIGGLGAALLYKLPLVGPALFIGCLSYLSLGEWRRVLALVGRVPGLGRLAARPAVPAVPAVPAEGPGAAARPVVEPAALVTVRGS